MSVSDAKECPICCETISARAKKCPHCHHWQSKWYLILLHPAFGFLCAILPLMLVWAFAAIGFHNWIDRPNRDFGEYRKQFVVLGSNVSFFGDAENQRVLTIGKVRNDSPYAWSEVEIEVQHFDAEHQLIDTATNPGFSKSVAAGDEMAFNVSAPAHHPQERYASHEVYVRWGEAPFRFP